MRPAPPVSIRCTGGKAWRWLQTLPPTLACGCAAFWVLSPGGPSAMVLPQWQVLLAALGAAALAGGAAWAAAAPGAAAHLAWDGQYWSADGVSGDLAVMLDLGGLLLLRLRSPAPARGRWLAVSAHEAGPEGLALRAALYATAVADAPEPAASGPAAPRRD
jgi:hypothetical protein